MIVSALKKTMLSMLVCVLTLTALTALTALPAQAADCHVVQMTPSLSRWETQIGGTINLTLKHLEPEPPYCPGFYVLVIQADTGSEYVTLQNLSNIQPHIEDIRLTVSRGALRDTRIAIGWELYRTWAGSTIKVWEGSEQIAVYVSDGYVPPRPDLTTLPFDASSPTSSWQNLKVRASGKNIGNRDLQQAEDLRIWIDGERNAGGQHLSDTRCHQNLWNDSTCDGDWEVHVEPGIHEVRVCADPDNNSGDRNHGNDCWEETIEVPPLQADLALFFYPSGELHYGEPWQGTLRVRNIGNGNSPPYQVRFETPDGVQTFQQGALGWGFHADVFVTWTPMVGGEVTLRAVVDPNGEVPDHDRKNNLATLTQTVIGSPPATFPNLTFEPGAWSVSPATPRVGSPVTIEVRMINAGEAPALERSEISILVAGSAIEACNPPLPPGGECIGSRTFTPDTAGDWLVELIADPNDLVNEGDDEGDNQVSFTFQVQEEVAAPKPQLFIGPSDLVSVGPIPNPGGDLTANITVHNGGGDIESEIVEVLILEDGVPNPATLTISPPFYGGSSRNLTYVWEGITAGGHELRAVVDPANAIDELLEDDNVRSLHFYVGGVTCQGIWELTDIATGDIFTNLGSVRDNCQVNWGNNVPDANQCYRTLGVNGMTATWLPGSDGCPTQANVSTGVAFTVRILGN